MENEPVREITRSDAHVLSWDTVMHAIVEVAEQVRKSGFVPDYLVGIATGGLIPLGILSKHLEVKNVVTVSAHSYQRGVKKELKVVYRPEINLRGKNILLIDEIAETGDTLHTIAEMISNHYRPRECRTLTLAVNESKCMQYPDFWILPTHADLTIFPWEKYDFPEHFETPLS